MEIRNVERIAKLAMEMGKCLSLNYGGEARTCEVHAIGCLTTGNVAMRVWQTGGSGKDPVGWKLLFLHKVSDPVVWDILSEAPRPGYKMDDALMATVYHQIEV